MCSSCSCLLLGKPVAQLSCLSLFGSSALMFCCLLQHLCLLGVHVHPAYSPLSLLLLLLLKVDGGRTELLHLLVPLGLPMLQPVLDIVTAEALLAREPCWSGNLLHEACGIQDPNKRLEVVQAIAKKAADLGLVKMFTMLNNKQQLPAAVTKNARLKRLLGDEETRAKKVGTAAEKAAKEAKAAAEREAKAVAAAAAADARTREEGDGEGGEGTGGEGGKKMKKKKQGGAEGDGKAAGEGEGGGEEVQEKEKQEEAEKQQDVAKEPAKPKETEKQRKQRIARLLSVIPVAIEAAAAPAAAAAGGSSGGGEKLGGVVVAARQAARDVAAIRKRIAGLAPEQLPEKDVALGDGLDVAAVVADDAAADGDGDGSALGGSSRAAASAPFRGVGAAGKVRAADIEVELEHELEEDGEELGGREGEGGEETDEEEEAEEALAVAAEAEVPGAKEAAAVAHPGNKAAAARAVLQAVNESFLDGLPWEFTITREALLEWSRLEE